MKKTGSSRLKSEITRRMHHLSKWHSAAKRSPTLRRLLRREKVRRSPERACGGVRQPSHTSRLTVHGPDPQLQGSATSSFMAPNLDVRDAKTRS